MIFADQSKSCIQMVGSSDVTSVLRSDHLPFQSRMDHLHSVESFSDLYEAEPSIRHQAGQSCQVKAP